jgi:hypothetical protein
MTEEPSILQMNITHYRKLLKLDLDDEKRSVVERLLAEANEHLVLAAVEGSRNSFPTF